MKQYSMVKLVHSKSKENFFINFNVRKMKLINTVYKPVIEQLSSQLGIDVNEVEQMSQRMSSRDEPRPAH